MWQYKLPVTLSLILLLSFGYLPAFQSVLILKTDAVLQGQIWRLFTGHFVHLGMRHLLMNAGAFLSILVWAWRTDQLKVMFLFVLICSPILGILLIVSGANWYAGLSGILHGVLVFLIMQLPIRLRVLGLLIVFAKLFWQYALIETGPVVESIIPISQASHLIGAVLGWAFYRIQNGIFIRSNGDNVDT